MLSEKQLLEKKSFFTHKRLLISKSILLLRKRSSSKNKSKIAKKKQQLKIINAKIAILNDVLRGKNHNYKTTISEKNLISFKSRMNQVKPLVQSTLKENLNSRDDDNLLCILVWDKQGARKGMKLDSFNKKLILNEFALPESITRCRRMLQQKHVHLRGKLYEERHRAESNFKTQYELEFGDLY